MSHQHIVKIQMNISTVFSILWDLKVSLRIGLTTVLTILHSNITQTTKHTSNSFCFSSMLHSYLKFYHDLFQIMINCIFLKIKSTCLCCACIFKVVIINNHIFIIKYIVLKWGVSFFFFAPSYPSSSPPTSLFIADIDYTFVVSLICVRTIQDFKYLSSKQCDILFNRCCRQNKGPPKCLSFNPKTLCECYLHNKKDFADMIKLRTLRWWDYPELSGWGLPNHRVP